MQGPQVLPSHFLQASTGLQDDYNFNMVGSNMFQLPAWATDSNVALVPETMSPTTSGKYCFYINVLQLHNTLKRKFSTPFPLYVSTKHF